MEERNKDVAANTEIYIVWCTQVNDHRWQ